MGIFSKNEKKLRREFAKKNISFCKEAVKEIGELYEDLGDSYSNIETVVAEFLAYADDMAARLGKEDSEKMEYFSKKLLKVDKCARDAVRDVRDLLRSQKKRLREAMEEA